MRSRRGQNVNRLLRSRSALHKQSARLFLTLVFATVALGASVTALAGEKKSDSYIEHALKIPALKREVDDLEKEIKNLIEEKRETDDESRVREMTNEIAEKYKQLKDVGEKLEEETALVRYKYPEQADTLEREYVRYKTKSLGDLESEAGIDGRLDKIKVHVLATFPIPDPNAGKPVEPKINPIFVRKPASVEDTTDMPDKIILSK